jgi:FAD/FMN-containing dehydrogenase
MPQELGIEMVEPQDPAYAGVRDVYSATGSPARVLLPRNSAEVARALELARSHGAPLAIRSGGHGISSVATNDGGTVIDLRRLNRVARLDGARVALGPGARWGAVARDLYGWGLALTSGDSGDVGVGGLATAGGIGLLGRHQGLTIDRMRAAEVVTADSRSVRVSEDENADLFWAVRGAGANVGIVTSFEFEAAATPMVARAVFAYELQDMPGFLSAWGAAVEAAPREVSAFLYVMAGSRPFAQATVVYAGDDTDLAGRALASFSALPGAVGAHAELVPYPEVPLTSGAPHSGQQQAVMHTGLFRHLDDDLVRRLADLLNSGAVQMVQIRSVGGAINDVDWDATAYAHRDQNFSVTAVADRAGSAFDDAWEPVRTRRDGMYLSFESHHSADDVEAAFPTQTLARLRDTKRAWDPDDVFSQNFDVATGREAGVRSAGLKP